MGHLATQAYFSESPLARRAKMRAEFPAAAHFIPAMKVPPWLVLRVSLAAGLSAAVLLVGCVSDSGTVEAGHGTGGQGSGGHGPAGSGGGKGSGGSPGSGGAIISASGGASSPGSGGTNGSGGSGGSAADALLPARIRRLTDREYDASVQALLGTTQAIGANVFPPDSRQGGFTVNDAQRVDPVLAKQLSDAATTLVAEARGNGKLASLAPCSDTTKGGAACATTFIKSFGAAAYRRALTDDEVSSLVTIYHAGADTAAYNDGIDLIARAVLQSAGFLYVTEIGAGSAPPATGAMVTMTPNETASVLAFLLTSAPPDSTLLAAASQLNDPDMREQQARRLLKTPAAQAGLVRLVREWLGIDGIDGIAKDTTVYPMFAGVKDDMVAESQDFVREVLVNSTGTVNELFSADWTIASPALAAVYGVKGASSGRTSLSSVGRRGILNQGAFLSVYAHASESGPVFRGVAIMRRVACMALGSPAARIISVVPPMPDPAKTTRDRFAAHVSDPLCAACHDSIDSIGFAFEKYDGMGMARPVMNGHPMENNQPVVTATTLGDKDDEQKMDFDGSYADSDALAMALAGSAQVRACMARQVFRSSAGRSDSVAADPEQAFVDLWSQLPPDKQGNVIETLVAYIRSPAFTMRSGQ